MVPQPKLTRAVLVKVVESEGYLVFKTSSLPDESVTVSIGNWIDGEPPYAGTDAVLEGLVHHRGGWRASRARYLQPDDRF